MPRRLIQRFVLRLVTAFALATVLLFARTAGAAIVPACEDHEFSRAPIEWLSALAVTAEMCVPAASDDVFDARVAAMCDARGASVVAPARVLPIVDARIDAARGCGPGMELSGPSAGPAPHDAPLGGPAFALADPALLGGSLMVPPAPSELGPAYPAAAGEARAGVRQGVERPPR